MTSTVPFRERFSGGLFVTYEMADFDLEERMVPLPYIIQMMDDEAKILLMPDPSDEVVARYYEHVAKVVERWKYAPDAPAVPDTPFPDRTALVLPEPIWTNVALSEDAKGMVVFTRVYGGVLKPEFDDGVLPECRISGASPSLLAGLGA